MTFTSFEFLLFFPAVVLFYNLCPKKIRVWFLLAVSYAFYAFMQPVYLILLAAVTGVTYGFTRWMGNIEDDDKKKRIMVWGIILVLLPLFFFKYYNFVNESILSLLRWMGITFTLPAIKWMLPVGISFYTFMAIGYIVDVNNEEVEVERNIGSVALFLSFFPYILSGPIERAGNMFPQLKELPDSTYKGLQHGFLLMLWGYFMKLCVADRLGLYVDAAFADVSAMSGKTMALAVMLYPFQVYADLGGYSLTAIGAAQCMGIAIIPNFNRPFFATSVSEFWRRWHMSLINWLTDYIYTPLSFMLRNWKIWGIVVSLMLTFLISGIWHGAALTFIVWGVVQGVYLCTEALLQKKRSSFENAHNLNKKWWYIALCCFVVYILFTFSQIFGRAESVSQANEIIAKIFQFDGTLMRNAGGLTIGVVSLAILMLYDFVNEFFSKHLPNPFNSKFWILRYVCFFALIIYILVFGELNNSQFIYFNF